MRFLVTILWDSSSSYCDVNRRGACTPTLTDNSPATPAAEAEEQPEDDLETTDEYEDDDIADGGEVLSDEDPQHWGERQSRGGLGDGPQPDDMMEGDLDVDIHDEEGAPTEDFEYEEMEDTTPVFDPAALGLKEINNLAHFSVSSHKPGNGVAELLSDDLDKYWQ